MASIAAKIGCTAETLRKWARQGERDGGLRGGLTTDEKQRMKELEREVDVEFATLDWVSWFNDQRLLGPIGDIPPAEFERMYYQQQESRLDAAGLN